MKRRLMEVDASIERYLEKLAAADQAEPAENKTRTLEDKIAAMRKEMARLKKLEARMLSAPDKQVSMTDPDARSMKTRGTGIVGYNVQTAVDTTHHLIVAHEVTNSGSDRRQLANMAKQAKAVIATEELTAVADRGYYRGEDILDCDKANIETYPCPNRIRQAIGPKANSTVVPSIILPKIMSMNVRLAYVWCNTRRHRTKAGPCIVTGLISAGIAISKHNVLRACSAKCPAGSTKKYSRPPKLVWIAVRI
jgi:hypothetical protein